MSLVKLLTALGASVLLALFLMLFPLPQAHAQTPTTGSGKIEGQLVDGTKDAKLALTDGMSVTLHMAPAGATSTISQTAQTDASGHFTISNLDTISSTRYLVIANYQGVEYYSDILSFDQNQLTLPVSVTVYETTTDPAAIKVTQSHFVFDVQTREFNILQIVAVQNSTDRTFIGSGPTFGPHRTTLALPFLPGAQNIEFDNPAANDATIRGTDLMSYTLPFIPGNDQIVYNYQLPFTPPTYNFSIKLPYNVDTFRILLADVGGTIQSSQLSAATPFPTQTGQKFIQSTANSVTAGTVIKADFVNLPATVDQAATTPPPGTNPTAPVTPANNNIQIVQGVMAGLVGAAVVALIVLFVRRRGGRPAGLPPVANERMELLQSIADLDDEYEAKSISEEEYKEKRARLKAELLELSQGEDE